MAASLFQPLLGLTAIELRRATDWWASLGTTEHDGFGGATRRASDFYAAAATALDQVGDSEVDPPAHDELAKLLSLCRARARLFEDLEATERLFEREPTRVLTKIGPLPVPARLVQAAADAARALRRLSRPGPPPRSAAPPAAPEAG